MGVKCTTPESAINQFFDKNLLEYREKVIDIMRYVGDEAVTEARTNHRYTPQTGNLKSSVGYCVLDNGKVVTESSFETVKNGWEGSAKGREFLRSLISRYSNGITLIVVAGMKYAVYVEAKNLNALDSAELLAEKLVPQMLKKLKP